MGRARLVPHPGPPPSLHARALPLRQAQGPWVRLHECICKAVFFGRTGENRFDAPNGEFGALYAGEDAFCAFIESFGDPLEFRVVSWRDLTRKCLSNIATSKMLRLVDLTGQGLRQIDADVRLTSGPHDLSQQWALRLWSHPGRPDGIIYRARHDPSKEAVALFDRSEDAITGKPVGQLTADQDLLSRMLDRYGFGLVE